MQRLLRIEKLIHTPASRCLPRRATGALRDAQHSSSVDAPRRMTRITPDTSKGADARYAAATLPGVAGRGGHCLAGPLAGRRLVLCLVGIVIAGCDLSPTRTAVYASGRFLSLYLLASDAGRFLVNQLLLRTGPTGYP